MVSFGSTSSAIVWLERQPRNISLNGVLCRMPCCPWSRTLAGFALPPIIINMENTRVLYNDTCPVCSFEIDAYRKRAISDGVPLQFDTLDHAAQWGISPEQAARRLHVLHNGQLLSGIPAFRALWGEMPHLRWLARLTGWPFIGAVVVTLYDQLLAPVLYWMHERRQKRGA